ncbi:MAG: hypothetical protein H6Q23_1641, partial [Bacteroidetes bacterium]|nr:hypothetical protein [Bacteroidota bacterium]
MDFIFRLPQHRSSQKPSGMNSWISCILSILITAGTETKAMQH